MANEKRLIDANALERKMFYVEEKNGGHGWVISLEDLSKAPTVDAVEVVRCKDCESHSSNGCPDHRVWCRRLCRYMDSDGFCSDGERENECPPKK